MNRILLFLFSIVCASSSAQTIMNIHQSGESVLQIPINQIDSITYSAVGDPGAFALVTTLPMSVFTATTVTLGGIIDLNSGTAVTARGIAWSVLPSPTTADSVFNEGSGSGTFSVELTGLATGVMYYARAYAINSAGAAYGNEVVFATTNDLFVPSDSVADADGNMYASLLMGNGDEWMASNLKTTSYANGDPIPNVPDAVEWGSLTEGGWINYNNNPQHDSLFGKLFNWYAVDDARNACPVDWHVATDAEWTNLTNYLGGLSASGGKLKSTGTVLWLSPNDGATNESGMACQPGGIRTAGGIFQEMFGTGTWWSSTPNNSFTSWNRSLFYTSSGTWRGSGSNIQGASVRCVRD